MYILSYSPEMDYNFYTIAVSESVELLKIRAEKYLKDFMRSKLIDNWEYNEKYNNYTGYIKGSFDLFEIYPIEIVKEV